MVEERWHDFAKEKPSEDMEGRDFIVSNGYSDTISMWCGGYWENEPFMGNRLCDEVVRWKGYLTPEEEKANERLKKQSSCTFSDDCLRVRQLKRKIADNSEKILELQKALDVALSEVYTLLDKIESLKASHYAEMVDAGMRERRLRRALWLARAERAEARKNYWYARSVHEGDNRLWSIDGSAVKYIGCIKRKNFDWLKVWSEVEIKCRDKAEEYK